MFYRVGLLLCVLVGTAQAADQPNLWAKRFVEKRVKKERREKVSYSVTVIDTQSGATLWHSDYEGRRILYPASTIKTLVAFAILRKVDAGEVRLDQEVEITQPNADQECAGRCAQYGRGKKITIDRLLSDMITWSSNIATNQLIDVATRGYINEVAGLLGASDLQVNRKVYVTVNPEPEITIRNRASVLGYVELYREIATGKKQLLTPASRQRMRRLLRLCHAKNRINASFPEDVTFWHKTGSTSTTSSDAGYYLIDARRAVIVVGLQEFRDYGLLRKFGADVLRRHAPIRTP